MSLQFQPFNSFVEVAFWQHLANHKLDHLKLSENDVYLEGHYTAADLTHQTPSCFSVDRQSICTENEGNIPVNHYKAPGSVKVFNTMDAFRDFDKNTYLANLGVQVSQDIQSGAALRSPSLLNRFGLLVYADLKTWKFTYWFAFPALSLPGLEASELEPISKTFSDGQQTALSRSFTVLTGGQTRYTPEEWYTSGADNAAFLVRVCHQEVKACPLSQWDEVFSSGDCECYLAFVDPCPLAKNPGWPLRNLLALACTRGLATVNIICYRPQAADISKSCIMQCQLPGASVLTEPKAVGWERTSAGKLAPRVVDLAPMMDHKLLAETAVDLNLKLMRWRVLPSLDTDKISQCRCLLLGAGTLGCSVSRTLLGWGVRTITMVDSGRVSHSNPVRQSLLTAKHAQEGRFKAEAAAESLQEIFPGVIAKGIVLSIPMPGHPVGDAEADSVSEAVAALDRMIDEHDVVFIGTDTRESRWLPTLMCAAKNKIAINSALAFDSFLVMRHGNGIPADGSENESASGCTERLGCYFCNDVVAPLDSMSGRTLDQQCTVTRPGLAPIAAALAVEIMVSMLHHTLGTRAPAGSPDDESKASESILGIIPHQVRGFLFSYNQIVIRGVAFDQCTACSQHVVSRYRQEGFAFLRRAFDQPEYLEQITGLAALKAAVNHADLDLDWDDEDSANGSNDADDLEVL